MKLLKAVDFANSSELKFGKEKTDIWEAALSDISDEGFEVAVNHAIKNCKFFPTIAELREFAAGNQEDKALLSWNETFDAVKNIGSWGSPRFDDPITSRVIQSMGGWMRFCEMKNSEIPFFEKEFIAQYGVESRQNADAVPVIGFIEKTNRLHNRHVNNSVDKCE